MNEKPHDTTTAQAFQEVIATHKGILLKVAKTYCLDLAERQDLVQEMLLQIWLAFPRYNAQFKISTWLYRIALNVAISFYRKNTSQKNQQAALQSTWQSTEEDSEKNMQLQLLEQLIEELNELDKALIILYLEDKSHAEIAEILGLSTTNVATKVGRIKEKLKKKFSNLKTD